VGCPVTFSQLQKLIDHVHVHTNERKDSLNPDVWSTAICQAQLNASWGLCGLQFSAQHTIVPSIY
jgi:hypothetical protein